MLHENKKITNSDCADDIFTDIEVEIDHSIISHEAMLHKFSLVKNSTLGRKNIVGDFSRIINSINGDYVRIDRNNLIYHSILNDYTYTGAFSVIMFAEIGKFSSISWGVTIGPAEHDYSRVSSHDFLLNDFYGLRDKNEPLPYDVFKEKCVIGNDVWIGTNCTILRGVKIGNGAVIGANAIVTKDIPDYAIAVGNPAKVIKYRFSKKIIEKLNTICWWNLPIEIIKKNIKLFQSKEVEKIIDKLQKI